jgi:hypothetical protein
MGFEGEGGAGKRVCSVVLLCVVFDVLLLNSCLCLISPLVLSCVCLVPSCLVLSCLVPIYNEWISCCLCLSRFPSSFLSSSYLYALALSLFRLSRVALSRVVLSPLVSSSLAFVLSFPFSSLVSCHRRRSYSMVRVRVGVRVRD